MNSPDNQMPEVVQKVRDLEKECPYISISGMTKNYEMGLLVRNDEVVQQLEAILMRIWGKEV